jgi:hypothetical protein
MKLRCTAAQFAQLGIALKIILEHGGQFDETTGGHINVGTAGMDPAGYARLMALFQFRTDTLYRLGNDPERRYDRKIDHARPNTAPAADYAAITSFDGLMTLQGGSRTLAINLFHVLGSPEDWAEFRFATGTGRLEVWQTRIQLLRAMIMAARNPATAARLEALGAGVEALGTNADRGLTKAQELEILRSLLDLLPLSHLARRQIVQLFASTRWLRLPRHAAEKPEFPPW